MDEKWDRRFLDLARHIAQWSKDPSTKCGAVIVRPDRSIASVGYNGFARNMDDSEELYNNREKKYSRVVHCEMNALLHCTDQSVKGYTLYTYPFHSCDRCAVHMIQAGIIRVVAPSIGFSHRWWDIIHNISKPYFEEADVEFVEISYD